MHTCGCGDWRAGRACAPPAPPATPSGCRGAGASPSCAWAQHSTAQRSTAQRGSVVSRAGARSQWRGGQASQRSSWEPWPQRAAVASAPQLPIPATHHWQHWQHWQHTPARPAGRSLLVAALPLLLVPLLLAPAPLMPVALGPALGPCCQRLLFLLLCIEKGIPVVVLLQQQQQQQQQKSACFDCIAAGLKVGDSARGALPPASH